MFHKLQQWFSRLLAGPWERTVRPENRTPCYILQDPARSFEKVMQQQLSEIRNNGLGPVAQSLQVLRLHDQYLDLALEKGWMVPANDVPRQKWDPQAELQLEITAELERQIEQEVQRHRKQNPQQHHAFGPRGEAHLVLHLVQAHQHKQQAKPH